MKIVQILLKRDPDELTMYYVGENIDLEKVKKLSKIILDVNEVKINAIIKPLKQILVSPKK